MEIQDFTYIDDGIDTFASFNLSIDKYDILIMDCKLMDSQEGFCLKIPGSKNLNNDGFLLKKVVEHYQFGIVDRKRVFIIHKHYLWTEEYIKGLFVNPEPVEFFIFCNFLYRKAKAMANSDNIDFYVLQDFEFILEKKYKKALGLDFSKYETLYDSRIQEYEVLFNYVDTRSREKESPFKNDLIDPFDPYQDWCEYLYSNIDNFDFKKKLRGLTIDEKIPIIKEIGIKSFITSSSCMGDIYWGIIGEKL